MAKPSRLFSRIRVCRVRVRLASYSSLFRVSAPYTFGRRISLAASKFRPCDTSVAETPHQPSPRKRRGPIQMKLQSRQHPSLLCRIWCAHVASHSMASAKILNDTSQHFDYRSPADLRSVSPVSCFPTGPSSSPTSASAFTSLTHISSIIRPTPTPNFPKSDPPYLMA